MRILHLTLKKKWFDMIASGCKTEEYRAITHYWTTRLVPNRYDAILFRNGYSKNSPQITVELKDIFVGVGSAGWGAPKERVFILLLGRILGYSQHILIANGVEINEEALRAFAMAGIEGGY